MQTVTNENKTSKNGERVEGREREGERRGERERERKKEGEKRNKRRIERRSKHILTFYGTIKATINMIRHASANHTYARFHTSTASCHCNV